MKKLALLPLAILISLATFAQPAKGPAKKGMVFGKKVTAKNAITVDQLVSKVAVKPTQVKVKGKVVDVCSKEGCWIKLATADGNMMVKMKDHSFKVPVDLNGKEVVVAGIAKSKMTSVKELQHYAEDAGKSEEEIKAIKEPKKEVILNATGVLVL